ncbi:hypothetical protein VPH5P1C_0037 [Vibrio phage 5P1c]
MWAKKEQLTLEIHEQDWLDNYKIYLDKSGYKPSEVVIDEVDGIALHFGCDSYLKWTYSNVEDCVCDNLYGDEGGLVNVQSLQEMSDAIHGGKNFIPSYGLTDLGGTNENILSVLLENYPELRNLQHGEDSYIVNLEIAEGGLRFHKNGGYRGKDCVGESIEESPADEYLKFSVFKVKA